MSIDDATAGRHQTGGIVAEGGQRLGRLPYQQRLVRSRRPGDVAEPFDRVHRPNLSGLHQAPGFQIMR